MLQPAPARNVPAPNAPGRARLNSTRIGYHDSATSTSIISSDPLAATIHEPRSVPSRSLPADAPARQPSIIAQPSGIPESPCPDHVCVASAEPPVGPLRYWAAGLPAVAAMAISNARIPTSAALNA